MIHLNRIQELVKEGFLKIFEDYEYETGRDQRPYYPPDSVKNTARSALAVVSKNNLVSTDDSNKGNGLQKAKSLEAGDPLNHGQLERMQNFLNAEMKAKVEAEERMGKSIENSGIIQSWNLYGGDAGYQWVNSTIGQVASRNDSSKTTRDSNMAKTKTLMDPHNTRNHSALSRIKNR